MPGPPQPAFPAHRMPPALGDPARMGSPGSGAVLGTPPGAVTAQRASWMEPLGAASQAQGPPPSTVPPPHPPPLSPFPLNPHLPHQRSLGPQGPGPRRLASRTLCVEALTPDAALGWGVDEITSVGPCAGISALAGRPRDRAPCCVRTEDRREGTSVGQDLRTYPHLGLKQIHCHRGPRSPAWPRSGLQHCEAPSEAPPAAASGPR